MGRARDLTEDVGALLILFALAKLSSWRWDGRDWLKTSKRGGRGAGAGATSTPVPHGAANLWSEVTMRVFEQQMRAAGVHPRMVLLGIAAASDFNADEHLGGSTGLLLVERADLVDVGYPGVPLFEEIDAVHQIPWIGKVIGYRISSKGGRPPGGAAPSDPDAIDDWLVRGVSDLAVLLHPANPTITEVLRNEATRRAREALGSALYIAHSNLLRHVLANP